MREISVVEPKPIKLYDWIVARFTLEGRAEAVEQLAATFEQLVEPGDSVLDICCGAGPFSFFFEGLGAEVTGIDNAPFMIDLATQEADRRGSKAEFVLADVLTQDLGSHQYDLAVFLGNTVADFPPEDAVRLAEKIHGSLRPDGRFAIHYLDGAHVHIEGGYAREEVEQDRPVRIMRRFKEYRVRDSALVETYRNEDTKEEYDYTSYVYTVPMVRRVVGDSFSLEQSVPLTARSFLDVFRKSPS